MEKPETKDRAELTKITELRKRLRQAHNIKGYRTGFSTYYIFWIWSVFLTLIPVQEWRGYWMFAPQAVITSVFSGLLYPVEFGATVGTPGKSGISVRAVLKYLPITKRQIFINTLKSRILPATVVTVFLIALQILFTLADGGEVTWLNIAMPIFVQMVIPAGMCYIMSR